MHAQQLSIYIEKFVDYLSLEEYSHSTIRSYTKSMAGLNRFLMQYAPDCTISKEHLIAYKNELEQTLKPASVNRHIAAINRFFAFLEMPQLQIKSLTIQVFTSTEKELTLAEFDRLLLYARQTGKQRVGLIMQTLAYSGIRVGELQHITVEALQNRQAVIKNKGKFRTIILPKPLTDTLLLFCHQYNIAAGSIFVNKEGQPLSRSYISLQMKKLAIACDVNPEKVFPHNFRHYFARRFLEHGYPVTDLADHLGHKTLDTTRRYLFTSTATKQKQLTDLMIHSYPQDKR